MINGKIMLTVLAALALTAVSAEVALPDFDAKTITGDELVALCAKVDRPLTEQEVDSLRERLAGRRLTFTFSAWQAGNSGSWLGGGEFMGVNFPDNGRYCNSHSKTLRCRFYLREGSARDHLFNRDERNLRVTGTVDAEREVAPKNGPMNYHLFLLVFTDSVIDRSAATTECCIPEFYGLRFGQPTHMPTNGLNRFVGEGGVSGTGRPTVKYRYQTWQRIDDGLRPAKFFDRALVTYSYKTLTPVAVMFAGHFRKGATRAECLKTFDEFVIELREKYAVRLFSSPDFRNEEEPDGFVPRDPPTNLKDWTWRYMPTRKFGESFARYEGGLNGCRILAALNESAFGERVVYLSVEGYHKKVPYRSTELEQEVMEGLLSYEEKEENRSPHDDQ